MDCNLCDPMDCNLPGSSVHGILQARILEWVTISFSRESSRPRDWTHVSRLAGRALTSEPPGKPRPNNYREECNSTHQQIIGLKLYWARPCPPEQDSVFPITCPSHQEAYTSLLALSIREQTEEARKATVPQQLKWKLHHRKLIRMKKQKVMSQMKR